MQQLLLFRSVQPAAAGGEDRLVLLVVTCEGKKAQPVWFWGQEPLLIWLWGGDADYEGEGREGNTWFCE